jgi:hypothetical protein
MSRKRNVLGGIVAGFVALGLLVAGCSSQNPVADPIASATAPAPGSPTGGPAADGAPPTGVVHVVIIVMENNSAAEILGNGGAPYINALAAEYALATNYRAITHPSLPNYLALTSGTTAGITDDCDPGESCMARVPNITYTIDQSKRTWKMYAESMPEPCAPANTDLYAVRHNPFMYYPGVTDNQASCKTHVVPLTQLPADLGSTARLPNYVFISPNVCNDTHDCPVSTGDAWLARQVPQILLSPAFTTRNSLLVITWDEGADHDNAVPTVFAGPAARPAFKTSRPYTHYSLLRTIESLWNLAPLTDNDRNAPVMGDMLK